MAEQQLEPLPEDWNAGLAIVAHPDDLEYGAASAIAKWTASGKHISYVLVTRGEGGLAIPPAEAGPLREAEERASAAVVGVDTVEFLGYQDGVIQPGLELRRDLAVAIRRHRPEVVISINFRDSWGGPSFNMADHRHVGLAVLDAIRDAANPWIFSPGDGEAAWNGVRFACFGASPQSSHFTDVTGYLDRGIASLEQHATYLEHVGTDATEMLTGAATAVGESVGCTHAVAWELIAP
jgi:LmbE family N-acetylglucosaminyl deacetylase